MHGAGLNAESWGDVPGRAINLPGHGGRPRAARATAEAFATEISPDVPEGAVLIGFSLGFVSHVAGRTAPKIDQHIIGV